MIEDTTDWTNLREFKGALLTRSYVLSWSFVSGSLTADLDLCLAAEHAFYEAPRPAQQACIRPAILEFPHCRRASADAPSRIAGGVAEAVRYLGSGAISGFRRTGEGRYEMAGTFGVVEIHSERPILRMS